MIARYLLIPVVFMVFHQSVAASGVDRGMQGNWAIKSQCSLFDEIGVPDPGVTVGEKELIFYESYCALSKVEFSSADSFSGVFECQQEGEQESKRIDLFLSYDGKLAVPNGGLLDLCSIGGSSNGSIVELDTAAVLQEINFEHRFTYHMLGSSSLAWVVKNGYLFYEYIIKPGVGQKYVSASRLNGGTVTFGGVERGIDEEMKFGMTLRVEDAVVEKDGSGNIKRMFWSGYVPINDEDSKVLVGFTEVTQGFK